MQNLIYRFIMRGIILQLEECGEKYYFSLSSHGRTDVIIYSSLDESLDMMQYIMDCLDK